MFLHSAYRINMVKDKEEKFNPAWSDCPSMEEWAEKMIRSGYIEIVQDMMKGLPDSSKAKYREMYRRIRSEGKK